MGKCARSAACNFAHDPEELQPLPDFHCTKMCPDLIATGHCEKGFSCTFAHRRCDIRVATSGCAKPASPKTSGQGPSFGSVYTHGVPVMPTNTLQTVLVFAQAQVLPTVLVATRGIDTSFVAAAGGVESSVGGKLSDAGEETSAWSSEDSFDKPVDNGNDPLGLSDTWSRQATEEEGLDAPLSEFSRQGTEEWIGLADEPGLPEIAEGKRGYEDKAQVQQQLVLLPHVAAGLGLACAVKNTFLEFDDQEVAGNALHRVRSTGDCSKSSF
eukprot:CAMPEP_0179069964 /NCGR_PEP_ID=MMETSP0796-20121207/30777_1 /TAXON_ID=73915 /ORGANISM="Pyrodinium bahamense, Strain pbaha01" /LENGTH=268 /DNA_ID=CAMNT_0020767043 /DNA_START=125 /DNA_END=931 /DNA_ORIENTATION=-